MGDPRKLKNKYKRPKKLWEVSRIKEESALKRDYGLKNMRELWIAATELRKYRREARKLLALGEEERARDEKKIINKLQRLGILGDKATIDDVLSLNVKDILERRLQTIVYRKGLAKTFKQARQLIVHRFIKVNGRVVTSPGYIVSKEIENTVAYSKPFDPNPRPPKAEKSPAEEGASGEVQEQRGENTPTPQSSAGGAG